jgi:hypothetical protein
MKKKVSESFLKKIKKVVTKGKGAVFSIQTREKLPELFIKNSNRGEQQLCLG